MSVRDWVDAQHTVARENYLQDALVVIRNMRRAEGELRDSRTQSLTRIAELEKEWEEDTNELDDQRVKEWERAEQAEAKVKEYEDTITWNTTCLQCAKVLTKSYEETCAKEKAEADLKLKDLMLGDAGDAIKLWVDLQKENYEDIERLKADNTKLREALAKACQCSWDWVTGESPNYFCGRCGKAMR